MAKKRSEVRDQGSETDMVAATLTPAEVNAPNFGKEPIVRIADGEHVIQFRIPFRISAYAADRLRRHEQWLIEEQVPCKDTIGGGPEPIVLTNESCEEGRHIIALNDFIERFASARAPSA